MAHVRQAKQSYWIASPRRFIVESGALFPRIPFHSIWDTLSIQFANGIWSKLISCDTTLGTVFTLRMLSPSAEMTPT